MAKLKHFWTDADRNYIKDNYESTSIDEMCDYLDVEPQVLEFQINKLGLHQKQKGFNDKELLFLKKYYCAGTNVTEIAEILDVSNSYIYKWAKKLGLVRPRLPRNTTVEILDEDIDFLNDWSPEFLELFNKLGPENPQVVRDKAFMTLALQNDR